MRGSCSPRSSSSSCAPVRRRPDPGRHARAGRRRVSVPRVVPRLQGLALRKPVPIALGHAGGGARADDRPAGGRRRLHSAGRDRLVLGAAMARCGNTARSIATCCRSRRPPSGRTCSPLSSRTSTPPGTRGRRRSWRRSRRRSASVSRNPGSSASRTPSLRRPDQAGSGTPCPSARQDGPPPRCSTACGRMAAGISMPAPTSANGCSTPTSAPWTTPPTSGAGHRTGPDGPVDAGTAGPGAGLRQVRWRARRPGAGHHPGVREFRRGIPGTAGRDGLPAHARPAAAVAARLAGLGFGHFRVRRRR